MSTESTPTPVLTLDQEEALLRERLEKIALYRKLARELGQPLGALGLPPTPAPATAHPLVTPAPPSFNGTIAGLIDCYCSDQRSPFFKIKYAGRNNYLGAFKRIRADIGDQKIADLSGERIEALYAGWTENGRTALGHHLVAKLRLLSGFGATVLGDDACIKFASLMRIMRFKTPTARSQQMTAEYAMAIRAKAKEIGWPSIALAQAIQFDLKLRSVEVIGEWVPMSEPGQSDVLWGEEKWMRGLRWSDIDDKLVLRFSMVDRLKRKKQIEMDLTKCPMVVQELDALGEVPNNKTPIIICEPTGRPYATSEFRRKWRLVANKAGVPDNVRNSDSIRSDHDNVVKQQETVRLLKK